jgi:hypothetical protein
VHCAINSAAQGRKLTRPVGPGPFRNRVADELRPGDCFTDPDAPAVKLVPCDRPHKAQVTHRFQLPPGPWNAAVKKKAGEGCRARWMKMFAKKRPPVPLRQWNLSPYQDDFATSDRLVLCYAVEANGRDLTRSVIPR